MPVLYGVFLYMGVASLSGIQVRLVPAAAAVYRNKLIFFVCVCVAGHLTYINKLFKAARREDELPKCPHRRQRKQNYTGN